MSRLQPSWVVADASVRLRGTLSDGEGACDEFDYGTQEHVSIPDPPYNSDHGIDLREDLPAPSVSVYERARIIGATEPLAVDASGRPILDATYNYRFDVVRLLREAGSTLGWKSVFGTVLPPLARQQKPDVELQDAVVLTRRDPHHNYYHWLTEFLPLIRGVEAYAGRTDSYPTVLTEPDPPSWLTELLDLVDVPRRKRLEWTHTNASVSRLVVPSFRRMAHPGTMVPSIDDLTWVRDRILSSVETGDSSHSSRIFVSREDVSGRRIENKGAIEPVLEEFDFETIVPTKYSVEAQVTAFRDADVVLGPHGAGLTNAIFSDDCTLIEALPDDARRPYFYFISHILDLDYEYLVGSEMSPDFALDPSSLRELLHEVV